MTLGLFVLMADLALAQTLPPGSALLIEDEESVPDTQFPYPTAEIAATADLVAVGAPSDGTVADHAGAVYVYARDGLGWVPQAKLTSASTLQGDHMGVSLDLDGSTIVAGAPNEVRYPSNAVGHAIVFERTDAGWVQTADLGAPVGESGISFGYSVAVDGDRIAVGSILAPTVAATGTFIGDGAVYLFKRTSSGWAFDARLALPERAKLNTLSVSPVFGQSVALDGDRLVVGAPQADAGDLMLSDGSGVAYVFENVQGVWALQARLDRPQGAPGAFFARRVAADAGTIVVSSPNEDAEGLDAAGAIYVYSSIGALGPVLPPQRLAAPVPAADDHFGWDVDISSGTLVASSLTAGGAVHVFGQDADGAWTPRGGLPRSSDPDASLGPWVATGGGTMAAVTIGYREFPLAVVFYGPDADADGLTLGQEGLLGTDPENADTDGDGLTDGDEVFVYKSDPTNPDSDGDGQPDGSDPTTLHGPHRRGGGHGPPQ